MAQTPLSQPAPPGSLSAIVMSYLKRLGPAAVLAVGSATLPLLGSFVLFYYINRLGDFLKGEGLANMLLEFEITGQFQTPDGRRQSLRFSTALDGSGNVKLG